MTLEIEAVLEKYVKLTEDGEHIDRFVCPVGGCDYTTRLGAGALRMHIILKTDPKMENRYDKAHEAFYNAHEDELTLDTVQYLHKIPRVELKD